MRWWNSAVGIGTRPNGGARTSLGRVHVELKMLVSFPESGTAVLVGLELAAAWHIQKRLVSCLFGTLHPPGPACNHNFGELISDSVRKPYHAAKFPTPEAQSRSCPQSWPISQSKQVAWYQLASGLFSVDAEPECILPLPFQ
jgi:hypothetical protein